MKLAAALASAILGAAPVATRVLPPPRLDEGPPLAQVLASRRSQRTFAAHPLGDRELGQLLWAAQGAVDGHRTAPSAGALYPLTVHVVDAAGVWRYVPRDHALVREAAGDRRRALATSGGEAPALQAAPVVLVITGEIAVTARKYGARADRYVALEAGHAAQNVLLAATALGLHAVPIGAFDDAGVRRVVGAGPGVTPLYLIPIGAAP